MVTIFNLEATQLSGYGTGDQYYSHITDLPGGGFAIVWMHRISNDDADIYMRRYDETGAEIPGSYVRVNTSASLTQFNPTITLLNDGGYVVTWTSDSFNGSSDPYGYAVWSQRYTNAGTTVGGNTRVNVTYSGSQGGDEFPGQGGVSVAALADGGYIVIWQGYGNQTNNVDNMGIFGRRYSVSGLAGDEFRINTTTVGTQKNPSVISLTDGGFLVTWGSEGQDTPDSYGIYGQRYSSTGAAVGGEYQINDYTAGKQFGSAAAVLEDGGYVIAWHSDYLDADGKCIIAQRFDEDGVKVGIEFRVNTNSQYDQLYPRVTALDDGGYIISWTTMYPSGSYPWRNSGTYASFQRYDSQGNRLGPETIINESPATSDLDPEFALLDDGSLVVTWWEGINSFTNDTSNVHHRIFRLTSDLTGSQLLYGTTGNDVLDGGVGADSMYGGLGNDTYYVDNDGDFIFEEVNGGTDLVISSVVYHLVPNVENLTLVGTDGINGIGNASNNIIIGNSGNNYLQGGSGEDTLKGEAGNDTYIVDNVNDDVVETTSNGTDELRTNVSYDLFGRHIELMVLIGTDNINATGNSLANHLVGNSGNNRIDGLAGVDTMNGGAGDDTYVVNIASDQVIEAVGGGTDTIETTVSLTLSSTQEVENLVLIGTADINLTGNGDNNTLTGNAGVNVLTGGGGDDVYYADASDSVVENASEGSDTVLTDVTYVLPANVENLVLRNGNINGTGNDLNNVLTGNSGTNRLTGGLGNDTYYIQNTTDDVVEAASGGTDVLYSSVSYDLFGRHIEEFYLTGTDNIDATGNSLGNKLFGNSGNNRLDGLSGIDTMQGGAGNDTYVVNHVSDEAKEASGEGTDTVETTASFTLSSTEEVENLTLIGTANINGTGNSLNNTIIGNSGNNNLTGSGGADVFLFFAGSGSDNILDFSAAQGDQINVNAYSGGIAFGGGVTITQAGSNTLVTLGSGNQIVVQNSLQADVEAHMIW